MQEIELLVRLDESFENAQQRIEQHCGPLVELKTTCDEYFYDPLRDTLKPDSQQKLYAAFRLREQGNKAYLTFKTDHFRADGKWSHSDEYETEVSDIQHTREIINCLGLKSLVIVKSDKYYFKTKDMKVYLERVDQLGLFLEIESERQPESDNELIAIRHSLQQFVDGLSLKYSRTSDGGKPEQLLNLMAH